MLEKKNNLVNELDFELASLERIIKNMEIENKLIKIRNNKKKLFIEKLKIIEEVSNNYF